MESPLVGRQTELDAARKLLERPVRVLTIWGAPGVGKTRFAHALAELGSPVAFVALGGAEGLDGMCAAVAPVLARQCEGWIVLDGLEHLLDHESSGGAVRNQLLEWFRACAPDLSFILTSRGRLRVPEEHSLELRPLDADEGLELFTQLVRRQRPDFDPEREDRSALLASVRALDGLPLALELAASRWEMLGTADLARRLSEPLHVLSPPDATASRHGTLRGCIAWSWDLLPADDQMALVALSVFDGAFGLRDAEAIVGPAALERVDALRNSGMLQVPAVGQISMLASIKAFVREHMSDGQEANLAEAHAAWLLERCSDVDAEPSVEGVRREVLPVARYLVARRDPRAARGLALLFLVAPAQHLDLFDEAVEAMDSPAIRLMRSRSRRVAKHLQLALDDAEAGLAMDPDPDTHFDLLLACGSVAYARGDIGTAIESCRRALAVAEASGNRGQQCQVLPNLALFDCNHGRFESSEQRYLEALEGARATGHLRLEAHVQVNLGILRQEQGLLRAAELAFLQAISLAQDARFLSRAEGSLAVLFLEMGRLEEARPLLEGMCERLADSALAEDRLEALAQLSAVEAALGDLDSARAHLREAALPWPRRPDEARGVQYLYEAFLAQAEGRHGDVKRLAGQAAELLGTRARDRILLRILRRRMTSEAPPLTVGDGWFEPPGGERADLTRYASMTRMFRALVDAREAEAPLDVPELFDAGWPGERIAFPSMRNRVHVNLAKLRTLGLREVLLRVEEGYVLDPTVPLRRAGPHRVASPSSSTMPRP